MSTHGGDHLRGGGGGGPEAGTGGAGGYNGGSVSPASVRQNGNENGTGQPRTFEVAIPITPPQHRLPQNVQQRHTQYTPYNNNSPQVYNQSSPLYHQQHHSQHHPQQHGQYLQPNQQYPPQQQYHQQQYQNSPHQQSQHQNHNYPPPPPTPLQTNQHHHQTSQFQTPQRNQSHSQYHQPPHSHDLHTPRRSHPPASPAPPQTPAPHTPEHSHLLISLAEAYFEAAHTLGATAAAVKGPDLSMYYKLVSTGLACLESVLLPQKGKTIQARLEAMVRLRYASVLFEETDNLQQAEAVLSKGIITTSRSNNLLDLNFSMQHLLVRVMFQLNPKAALIQLNKYTKEAEERENVLWMYAFRFLRCHLLTENSQCKDLSLSLHGFRSISGIAARRNDISIFILSSLMEALIHLHNGPEGVEPAQRAIAKANSMQLDEEQKHRKGFTELKFLGLVVDLVCALMMGRPSAELEGRLLRLQALLSVRETREKWSDVGDFEVPVHLGPRQQQQQNVGGGGGSAGGMEGGEAVLRFRWFARDDLFIVGYFLSGLARFQANTQEAQKAEKYLKEGLRRIDLNLEINGPMQYSIPAAESRLEWRKLLRCFMLVYLTFLLCIRTEWDEAIKTHKILTDHLASLSIRADHPNIDKLTSYLSGTIAQGTGNLSHAMEVYETIMHDPSEIGVMATLNMVFILRGAEMRDSRRADGLVAGVERACMESKNSLLKSAFYCVKGTERGELIKSKKFLATALQSAQQLTNQQIVFIVLSFMCHRFFSGVVSEQAEKSAKAAYVNAKKGKDSMWSYISGRMLQDCLARQGQDLEDIDAQNIEASYYAVVNNLGRDQEEEEGDPEENDHDGEGEGEEYDGEGEGDVEHDRGAEGGDDDDE